MNKIAVGMSGGVDSSVTAYLLKKQGYEVTGVYLQMIDDIHAEKAAGDAKKVADQIGIDFNRYDIRDKFKEKVIAYFTESYLAGVTPNPCVVCNKEIKFKLFFDLVKELGIDTIATGHYVKVEKDTQSGKYLLKKAEDERKDQTYFLYNLTQEVLQKVKFPLGDYKKDKVKEMADEAGLHVAKKSESQEICFISDNDYKSYLKEYYGDQVFQKGPIIDQQGNFVGEHTGLPFYTIGQRKGIGLSLDYPAYVTGFNQKENVLYIGEQNDLFTDTLTAEKYNLLHLDSFDEEYEYDIKIRYSNYTSKGYIKVNPDQTIIVNFKEPQRAVTPGQSVVFYDGDILIGGAVIR